MNKMIAFIIVGVLGCIAVNAQTANYWQQTNQPPTFFEGQGNMCIIVGNNDELFVGTMRSGIFRSTDRGNSWENVLPLTDTAIEQIVTTPTGKVFAIGATVLFYSDNDGNNWKRKPLPVTHYLTDIVVLDNEAIMVSTCSGVELPDETFEYIGDGVLISKDFGETWTFCNNGIGKNKAVSHIARSSDGTLVMAMPALYGSTSGLYLSKNNGNTWKRLNHPKFKDRKRGDILTPTNIYEVYCLEIDPDDNLFFSFEGASPMVGMSGGLSIHIKHILTDSLWKPVWLNELGYEWQYHPFYSIYRSKHNHLFASLSRFNSVALGGAHVSSWEGPFRRIIGGIEPVMDSYLKVVYAEDSYNRIYAIQLFDHRVYFNDSATVQPTSVDKVNVQTKMVSVFPVPAYEQITVQCNDLSNHIQAVCLYNCLGTRVYHKTSHTRELHIPVKTLPAGIYFLTITTEKGEQQCKIVVKE